MLEVTTRHFGFIKKKEVWFYNGDQVKEAPYTVYCYVDSSIRFDKSYDRKKIEQTSVIHLDQTEHALFEKLGRTTRLHVRKGIKNELLFKEHSNPSWETCLQLIASFNDFAQKRNITRANQKRIGSLQRSGNLFITEIVKNNRVLCTHSYLGDGQRAVLLYSFGEEDGGTNAYANKYLHWRDMLLFKEKGYRVYDLGGINPDLTPGITRFKLSFGGDSIEVDNYIRVAWFIRPFYRVLRKVLKHDV